MSRTKACKEAFGAEKLKEMVTESKKKNVKERVGKHREKRRAESPETFKKKIKLQVAKWRKRENSEDRLKAFREGTMHGADFVCVCCEQRMMCSNVLVVPNKILV